MTENKHLTRQQRRFIERVEIEAKQTHSRLFEKFFNFFIDHDEPEGEEVVKYMYQLSAQWKLYCSRKRLNKEAYGLFEQECHAAVKEYLRFKESKKAEIEVKENS